MARERMVTRTVELTQVEYLAMDITTAQAIKMEFHFIGTAPQEKILKEIKSKCDSDTIKAVAITSCTTTEKLYGIPEWEFVEYAQELDPTTRKYIDTIE